MRRRSAVWFAAGILCFALCLALTGYNLQQSRQAQAAAQDALQKMVDADAPLPSETQRENEPETMMIDGKAYIGAIEIPSLKLQLPVLADWSAALLKTAPCRYAGSCYTDDFVICGHNYASHFDALRHIEMGADVYFTTVGGEVFHYITVNRESLRPAEVERMREPDGTWDLTLFTCDIGGGSRCTVRCERADETY